MPLMRFLKDRRNREVLSWLGGGLVVVLAGGAWAVFTYLRPPEPAARPQAEAARHETVRPASVENAVGAGARSGLRRPPSRQIMAAWPSVATSATAR